MAFQVPAAEPCPFCENVARRRYRTPEGTVTHCAVVDESNLTLAFLSPRQVGKAHVLVIPKRHVPTILDLTAEEVTMVARHVWRLSAALAKTFQPTGLNIYQNNGVDAGQSVGHYHTHIVPRYAGSEPAVFSSRNLPRTPYDELLVLAGRIREGLA